jgi:hypothetical protein
MKKKIIIILLVAFLLLGETVSLFAVEGATSQEDSKENYCVSIPSDSPPTPCGEGNGGGNPG